MAPDIAAAVAAATATLTRVVPVPIVQGYGVDLDCFDDLTAGLAELDPNSTRGISQEFYHRLTTDPDATFVREDDPNYGFNIAGLLHQGVRADQLRNTEARVAAECQKSDRVLPGSVAATITVTFGPPTSFRVAVTAKPVNPALGEFTTVMAVTDGKALLEATEQ